MNKIIFCQTPFQVIISLLIRKQFSSNTDRFDIVIVNFFSGYDRIASRLIEQKYFDNVYVAEVKDFIQSKGVINNIKKFLKILFPQITISKSIRNIADTYDEMFCWNYDAFTALFRAAFSSPEKRIKLNIYDEGFISYLPIDDTIPKRGFMKIIEKINCLKGMPYLTRENVDAYYLLEPNAIFFDTKSEVHLIDRKDTKSNDIKKLIDFLFDASEEVKKYDRKYILLEEAFLANVSNVDDEAIFMRIIEHLGVDNVLIKLHPRTNKDRFSKKGIKTIGQSGVPFEALALCGDFSEKKLIGISCGTIPTYRMLFGDDFDGYLLFKFIKPDVPWFKDKYSSFWNRLEAEPGKKGIHFPKSEESFYRSLL